MDSVKWLKSDTVNFTNGYPRNNTAVKGNNKKSNLSPVSVIRDWSMLEMIRFEIDSRVSTHGTCKPKTDAQSSGSYPPDLRLQNSEKWSWICKSYYEQNIEKCKFYQIFW